MTPIIQLGSNAGDEAVADDAGVLVDAADYYLAFYRAAERSRRYILMSGWQFDRGVPLLRGADVPAGAAVRFLEFLDGLCRSRPDLHIYILAWDFHVVFALEREWMQRAYFHWMTHSRFRFRFDDQVAAGGSHHQKFVVFDGALAFLGGMDVCEARWDDRCHKADNPLRTSRGKPQKPYHDVQAWFVGREIASRLERLFADRWARSGGPALALPRGTDSPLSSLELRGSLGLGAGRVALSRTDPKAIPAAVREVEELFAAAIRAAERLIYVETQYFSSQSVLRALLGRMRAGGRSRLEIVIVVNRRAEALKEEIAVGLRQAKILETLRQVAARTGHALGLYYSLCDGTHETFRETYIHSKVAVVDDRFLTVGSANLTNRSMAVDSELHASWEARSSSPADRRLGRAIRRVRVSLLAEHSGSARTGVVRELVPIAGLVARLDRMTERAGARLQRHGPPTPTQEAVMEVIDPEDLPFDPEAPDAAGGPLVEPDDEPTRGRRRRRVGETLTTLWRAVRVGRRHPAP